MSYRGRDEMYYLYTYEYLRSWVNPAHKLPTDRLSKQQSLYWLNVRVAEDQDTYVHIHLTLIDNVNNYQAREYVLGYYR